MSEKERLIYETFGGRDTIIKNYMKLYDSNGNFLNAYGVAGMCVDGKSPSEYNQIIDVSEDWRHALKLMFIDIILLIENIFCQPWPAYK